MKYLLLIAVCICHIQAIAIIDSIKIDGQYLPYHIENNNSNSLIIFLHGGVSQFKDKTQPICPTELQLLENNTDFLQIVKEMNYDIILPIAYNQYNWLEADGERYINLLLENYKRTYKDIYIAGFSDGGTGAYRAFYNAPEKYEGVMIFNGYPQLGNYYKSVKHIMVRDKKVLFFSTKDDKRIPYEFLLIEYRRQKIVNKRTYFILRNGNHSFKAYSKKDFTEALQLLKNEQHSNTSTGSIEVYPAIDAYIVEDTVKEIYSFRKKTGKQYNMSATERERDDYNEKEYNKLLEEQRQIIIHPSTVTFEELKILSYIEFPVLIDGKDTNLRLINWLNTPTW